MAKEYPTPTPFVDIILQVLRGQHYGVQYSCCSCDSTGGRWSEGLYKVREEPTLWWMGLAANGQAHYLCDNCKPCLYNVHPVVDL